MRQKQETERIKELAAELEMNNERIRRPYKRFWNFVQGYLRQNPQAGETDKHFEEEIVKQTDFEFSTYGFAEPLSNQQWFEMQGAPPRHWNLVSNAISRVQLNPDTESQLFAAEKSNHEILVQLCKAEIQNRVGPDFSGEYPCPGIDVDLPYNLGGRWVLIETSMPREKLEKRIRTNTEYGAKGLSDGRLTIADNKDGELEHTIRNFPDVLLVKCPTPAFEPEEVVDFYKSRAQRPLLVVADREIDNTALTPLEDISGIKGASEFRTETIEMYGGGIRYPLIRFRSYMLR